MAHSMAATGRARWKWRRSRAAPLSMAARLNTCAMHFQCPILGAGRGHHAAQGALQQERLRIHDWRPVLHSEPLQHRQEEDICLLVAGMAARKELDHNSAKRSIKCRERRNFSDLCPDVNDTMNDCPSSPGVSAAHTLTPTATGAALLAIIPEANTTNGGFPAV